MISELMVDTTSVSGCGDDWSAVRDNASRRRIQNRLAQRAHRLKHGREPKRRRGFGTALSDTVQRETFVQTLSSPGTTESNGGSWNDKVETVDSITHSNDANDIHIPFQDSLGHRASLRDNLFIETVNDINTNANSRVRPDDQYPGLLQSISTTVSNFQAPSPFTDQLLIIQTMGTLSALLLNASILQIDCHTIRGLQIYIPDNLHTPATLTPTTLQTSTPHLPYVDLIPFPSIRDKLLQSQNTVNGFEIWNDIIRGVRIWGNSPWDDRGWELGEGFVRKWWWLIDDDVLGTTNFWRGARDERVLSMVEVKRMSHVSLV